MVFSTDSELFYIKMHYKSEKVHGLFSWGETKQGHTVFILVKFFTKDTGSYNFKIYFAKSKVHLY